MCKQTNEVGSHGLEAVFAAAKEHPVYKNSLRAAGKFAEAPVIDKKTYFRKTAECFESPGFLKGMYISASGGSSSGKVNYVATDVSENLYQRAVISAYLSDAGIITDSTIALNLMPGGMMYRAAEIFTEFCNRAGSTLLPLTEYAPDELAFSMSETFAANTIIAMPSRAVSFAEYLRKHKLNLQFDHMIFAGEPLSESRRDYLKAVLKIKKFSGVFGSAESGVWGFQPDFLPVNTYFIAPELVHLEIASPDAQGFGSVIITNLVRMRNPLLRYDSGDRGRLVKSTYQGMEIYALELQQRASASFEIGGNIFTVSDKLGGCSNFQIKLSFDPESKKDKVSVFLVTDGFADQKEKDEITQSLKAVFHSQENGFLTEIRFVRLDSLVKSPSSQKPIRLIDSRQ